MTDLPADFRAIIETQVTRHPDDIDTAVRDSMGQIESLSTFGRWRDQMVFGYVRMMVHDQRHRRNVQLRKDIGDYGKPAHVKPEGPALAEAAQISFLNSYSINGRMIGSLSKAELLKAAETDEATAAGKLLNARLCRALAKHARGDLALRDCVTDDTANKVFQKIVNAASKAA